MAQPGEPAEVGQPGRFGDEGRGGLGKHMMEGGGRGLTAGRPILTGPRAEDFEGRSAGQVGQPILGDPGPGQFEVSELRFSSASPHPLGCAGPLAVSRLRPGSVRRAF